MKDPDSKPKTLVKLQVSFSYCLKGIKITNILYIKGSHYTTISKRGLNVHIEMS